MSHGTKAKVLCDYSRISTCHNKTFCADKTPQKPWGRQYFSGQMSRDYEEGDSDFATAVAAAAFAVHSLEHAEIMRKEALEASRTKAKSRKGEITVDGPSSSKPTRLFSNKEAKRAGAKS